MEARTNPFYELYDRLYAAAAAGTAVISEDFRLKRAVEAFEPLAQKNKVFGRLHDMCAKLFTSENAPSDIADCLALAEALAVAQGDFLDSSGTQPAEALEGFAPRDIPYSELNSLKEMIAKARYGSMYIPKSLPENACDPRLALEFAKYSDSDNENVAEYAKVFGKACGSSLAVPLFDSIDMTDPKAKGRQIEYIADIAGRECISRFKAIAFDEEAPSAVRVNAINAMSRFEECADDLIELFQTSKGKISTAALEAVAKISPPQAEPIFEKLAAKYKAAYDNAFSYARYPVCSQHARDVIKKCLAEEPDKNIYWGTAQLLSRKTDVYDCFELILKRMEELSTSRFEGNSVQNVMMQNLVYDKRNFEEYALMTEQLYRRYPDRMMRTRLILELERSGENAFDLLADELHEHITELHSFVKLIEHDYSRDIMYVNLYGILPRYPFFDRIPDGLIRVLSAAEPTEKNDPENVCQALRHLRAVYNKEIDENKAKDAALKYSLLCEKYYPNFTAVQNIMAYGGILPEGAVRKMILFTLEKKGKLPGTMYTMPSTHHQFARQIHKEFLETLELIPKMKLSESAMNDALATVRGAIRMTEDYIKRYNL